jgi:hypothetical protein
MECLGRVETERAKQAVDACDRLGKMLGWKNEQEWKTYVSEMPYATENESHFGHHLITLCDDELGHAEQAVIGWRGPDGIHWLCSPRPGFRQGSVATTPLFKGMEYWQTTDYTSPTELGVEVDEEFVIMISQGWGGERGCAAIPACRVDEPFPKDQIERLAALFGRESDAVQFARNPKRALCGECGAFSLSWYAEQECFECGASRDEDD